MVSNSWKPFYYLTLKNCKQDKPIKITIEIIIPSTSRPFDTLLLKANHLTYTSYKLKSNYFFNFFIVLDFLVIDYNLIKY